MKALKAQEEFVSAQIEVMKRRAEHRAAQSYLIQAEERFRKASAEMAKEMGLVGAQAVDSRGRPVVD